MSSPANDNDAPAPAGEGANRGAVDRALAADLASPSSTAAAGDGSAEDAKAHSFRERRLTYSRHHVLSDAAAAAVAQLMAEGGDFSDEDSVAAAAEPSPEPSPEPSGEPSAEASAEPSAEPSKAVETPAPPQPSKPQKRKSDASARSEDTAPGPRKRSRSLESESAAGSVSGSVHSAPYLPPRILHAGEIVRRHSSSANSQPHDARKGLYSHPTHPHHHQNEKGEHVHEAHHRNKWRKRFSFCSTAPDHLLPFPRDVVGTYSCHGMEPVYESDYSHSDEEEETPPGSLGLGGKKSSTAKINQDRGGIAYPYAGDATQALFAVYDGHGEGGELVSQYALTEVGRLLEGRLRSLPRKKRKGGGLARIAEEEGSDKGENATQQTQQDDVEEEEIKRFLRETFIKVDRGLLDEDDIEPMYSGTTACAVLLRDGKLYVSNCGDSRAVLAQRPSKPASDNEDRSPSPVDVEELVSVPLSIDQNPDSPGEEQRILLAGGYVSPPPEPGLSARVWLDPSHTQIGLAMARSIGDHAVKGVGVIAEPVVQTHAVGERDEFLVIATDGVWEFISSEDAVDIVARHLYQCEGEEEAGGSSGGGSGASRACEALIKAASEKWHEHEGDYRDDITAIVIRLKDLMSFDKK
ncbi:hypothetical protein ACHAXT_002056 [Thalassiosira profunda]